MKKFKKITVCMVVLAFLLTGCVGKFVGTVNGEKITQVQLNAKASQIAARYQQDYETMEENDVKEYVRQQALEELIQEKLIFEAAKEKNIKIDNKAVDDEIKKNKAQFKDEKEFKSALYKAKMTEKDLRNSVKFYLTGTELFEEVTINIKKPTIDPEKYYDENKKEFYEEEQIRASHIMVKTEEEAKEIIKHLDKGEDFAELALEKSIDENVETNKGDVGFFTQGAEMAEEFKTAAFKLKVGEYTKKPVQTEFGYHIIKLEERKEAHQKTFDEAKADLEKKLLAEEKDQKFQEFMDAFMKKSKIERNLPKTETTAKDGDNTAKDGDTTTQDDSKTGDTEQNQSETQDQSEDK